MINYTSSLGIKTTTDKPQMYENILITFSLLYVRIKSHYPSLFTLALTIFAVTTLIDIINTKLNETKYITKDLSHFLSWFSNGAVSFNTKFYNNNLHIHNRRKENFLTWKLLFSFFSIITHYHIMDQRRRSTEASIDINFLFTNLLLWFMFTMKSLNLLEGLLSMRSIIKYFKSPFVNQPTVQH